MRLRILPCLFLLVAFLLRNSIAFAESFFDFDEINAPKKKKAHSAAVESYMERVYGSGVTVGPKVEVLNNSSLRAGKGKNSGIVLSFDDAPISSFAVDSQVFKKGAGFVIKADGVIIYQHLLTKAEKRTGVMETIDPIFFDKPVYSLEFVGLGNSKVGIDNLLVNLDPNQTRLVGPGGIAVAAVPESSSLLLFGAGLMAVARLLKRSTGP